MNSIRRNAIINSIIICMLVVVGMFAFNINSAFVFSTQNSDVIYHGNTDSKNISLMINVYWGNEYLPDMLKVLKDNNVTTTFFVGGTWVNKYPELFMQIVNDGHEIGNHGYFHKDQDKLDYQGNYDEINVTHKLVKSLSGVDMNLFAPPSGAFNKSTLDACKKLGYQPIMWTYDTIDWRDQDSNLIFKRATKNMKGGNLILMHPTEKTLQALPNIINEFKNNGFNLTTVTNTLK